jgi:uncharacterized Zn finger protein
LEQREFDDAERWAREGIAATSAKLPGIAGNLAASLRELARQRQQWDVVAAHAAQKFFDNYPGLSSFDELMKAARQAGVEEPVRAAALRFLETGVRPYRVVASRSVAPKPTKSSGKKSTAGRRAATVSISPEPTPARAHVKIDPAWPLPVPDYLISLEQRYGHDDSAPQPYLNVLLDMALVSQSPDEVLHWFDTMRSAPKQSNSWYQAAGYADRVAAAVSAAYPELALEIYGAALDAQLPHTQQSAYQNAAGYLRKMRPIYETLHRANEWTMLLVSIREKYRNRPRFMEQLDRLEGQTIVEETRARRK